MDFSGGIRSFVRTYQTLSIEDVYKRQEDIPLLTRIFENVPIVGTLLFVKRMMPLWTQFDKELTTRDQSLAWKPTGDQEIVFQVLARASESVIGWTKPVIHQDDDVGALLWDPSDVLAGPQVLIDLERRYSLSEGALAWDLWEKQSIRSLVEFIVAHRDPLSSND